MIESSPYSEYKPELLMHKVWTIHLIIEGLSIIWCFHLDTTLAADCCKLLYLVYYGGLAYFTVLKSLSSLSDCFVAEESSAIGPSYQ